MCGISGLISFDQRLSSHYLMKMTEIINHRGPDDEGYLLWSPNQPVCIFNGKYSAKETIMFNQKEHLPVVEGWKVGVGHKRLSILDLSPLGQQPMIYPESDTAIAFNGEVYNYKELREDLIKKGYDFRSKTDTEVILKAWIEWGPDALNRFNGMFAILIFEPLKGKFYAVRDRFGVKPLYWTYTDTYMAFASEIKQLRTLPQFRPQINLNILFDYIAYGLLDHTDQTFNQRIYQLMGGELIEFNLIDNSYQVRKWYSLPKFTWKGTEKKAIEKFKELLTDSVRIRLRSDVPVGSCLSGGLDSSTIVCLMDQILKDNPNQGIKTVTACYEQKKYDEWEFATSVIELTKADSYRIFPTFDDLMNDLEKIFWYMDEPFGSTSQFSQWSVFKKAASIGLKVMLDGQGSDEQLAGYNGNEQPLFTGLFKKFKFIQLINESVAFYKQHKIWPKAQLIGAACLAYPCFKNFLPSKFKRTQKDYLPSWLILDKFQNNLPIRRNHFFTLNDFLRLQTLHTSLPALLRYEDRNSMAFSIESRVPFMDYRLVEFNLSLPEQLVLRNGTRKYILREAMKKVLPPKIYNRHDKMGFVTPEEVWFKDKGKDWLLEKVKQAQKNYPYLISSKAVQHTEEMIKGLQRFDFSYWRLASLGMYSAF
jgi:asparagine synthase (glutamine-hydrolysing)